MSMCHDDNATFPTAGIRPFRLVFRVARAPLFPHAAKGEAGSKDMRDMDDAPDGAPDVDMMDDMHQEDDTDAGIATTASAFASAFHADAGGVEPPGKTGRGWNGLSGVVSPASPLSVSSNFSATSNLSAFSDLSELADASRLAGRGLGRGFSEASPSGSGRVAGIGSARAAVHGAGHGTHGTYNTAQDGAHDQQIDYPCALPRAGPAPRAWCLGDFSIGKRVGSSKLSNVFHATHKLSGMDVALKCYLGTKLDAFTMTQVRREIEIHAAAKHRAIATFHGSFTENGDVVMIHEYARRGDVYNALSEAGGTFDEQRTSTEIIGPVASAVHYLHNRGVMHRDIKPENILLGDNAGCLLTDFGFALDYRKNRCVTRLGTTDYMAPEIVRCDKPRRDALRLADISGYGPAVDCWAIGVLAYECLVGTAPFEVPGTSPSTEQTYERILRGAVPAFPPSVSENAKRFINGCLRYDPAARFTASQILNHPWLKKQHTQSQRTTRGGDTKGETQTPRDVFQTRLKGEPRRLETPEVPGRAGDTDVAEPSFELREETAVPGSGGPGEGTQPTDTTAFGGNLRRGLGRLREYVFSGSEKKNPKKS